MARKFEETKDIIDGAREFVRRLRSKVVVTDQELGRAARGESLAVRAEFQVPRILNLKHYP